MISFNKQNYQQRIDNILSVFTKTVEQLSTLNSEIYNEKIGNEAVIIELEDKNKSLDKMHNNNRQTIEKINFILTNEE